MKQSLEPLDQQAFHSEILAGDDNIETRSY
jgi:hypothetical protein